MPVRLPLLLVLPLVLARCIVAPGDRPDAEQRRVLVQQALAVPRAVAYWTHLHRVHAQLVHLGLAGETSGASPENVISNLSWRLWPYCEQVTPLSPTWARIEPVQPTPSGCGTDYGTAPYELRTARVAGPAFEARLGSSGYPTWGAAETLLTLVTGGTAARLEARFGAHAFEGTAVLDIVGRTMVLDGRGVLTLRDGRVLHFRAEALERWKGVCMPRSGRLVVELPEGLPEAGVERAAEVSLAFGPEHVEVELDGEVERLPLDEAQCACFGRCEDAALR